MEKTKDKSLELTDQGRGKHHIGDFLPPEELTKFMNKVVYNLPPNFVRMFINFVFIFAVSSDETWA